jgi:N-acyl-D-aspartate/D-glutamate deacylase
LLPQGDLREEVLRSEQRAATDDELTEMKSLTTAAMEDGAWGMSTGLIYVPSSYADTAELIEIAKVVSDHGGIYASHVRDEGVDLLDAVSEAAEIGRQADIPVHISHLKSSGKDSWGLVRVAIEEIKKHREAGIRMTADQYPYVASSTSLAATFLPTWARAGGTAKMLERLRTGPDV